MTSAESLPISPLRSKLQGPGFHKMSLPDTPFGVPAVPGNLLGDATPAGAQICRIGNSGEWGPGSHPSVHTESPGDLTKIQTLMVSSKIERLHFRQASRCE